MCNRFQLQASSAEVAATFGLTDVALSGLNLPHEMFPRRPGLVLTAGGARLMEWGWPGPKGASGPVTNVRNLESPFWRGALANPERRCLIPMTRFCEWEGEAGAKRARWFGISDQPVFAAAGVWRPLDDGAVFAMLTTAPNPLVAAVHPKAMPVLLAGKQALRWTLLPWEEAQAMVASYPAAAMWVE